MSLRIIIQPTQIESWINDRRGIPARRLGTEGDLRILFSDDNGQTERLTMDELFEAMKSHHLALLVDQESGKNFHQFVVRA